MNDQSKEAPVIIDFDKPLDEATRERLQEAADVNPDNPAHAGRKNMPKPKKIVETEPIQPRT